MNHEKIEILQNSSKRIIEYYQSLYRYILSKL